MQKIGKVKSPRCVICQKVEFNNRVGFGVIIASEDKVNWTREIMCKDCESKQRKVAEDDFKRPIYVKA